MPSLTDGSDPVISGWVRGAHENSSSLVISKYAAPSLCSSISGRVGTNKLSTGHLPGADDILKNVREMGAQLGVKKKGKRLNGFPQGRKPSSMHASEPRCHGGWRWPCHLQTGVESATGEVRWKSRRGTFCRERAGDIQGQTAPEHGRWGTGSVILLRPCWQSTAAA